MLRLNRALQLSGSISRIINSSTRAFGAHAHGHATDAHGHSDHSHGHGSGYDEHGVFQPVYRPPPGAPYDAKHEHIDRTKAFMFGEDPNHPKEAEGWETITYITYIVMFGILFAASYNNGDPLRDWAKKEALARETATARGEKIEYGKFLTFEDEDYTDSEYTKENIGVTPDFSKK